MPSFQDFETVRIYHGINKYDAELLLLAVVTMIYRSKETAFVISVMFLVSSGFFTEH
jgi:hypothetical protein